MAANAAVELFNGGAKALEQGFKHRFGPYSRFGLRMEIGVKSVRRVKGSEEDFIPEKHIVVRPLFRDAWSRAIVLLQMAINENRTLTITTPDKPIRQLSKSELVRWPPLELIRLRAREKRSGWPKRLSRTKKRRASIMLDRARR